jgi:hypothetical protein
LADLRISFSDEEVDKIKDNIERARHEHSQRPQEPMPLHKFDQDDFTINQLS